MLYVRRVSGESMTPALRPGQLILGVTVRPHNIAAGSVVIFRHNGLEKIKRVYAVHNAKLTVYGDNQALSTDSRSFGSINRSAVFARVVWPRLYSTS